MWPVGRGIRRYGVSDYLFAKTPWAVVQAAIEKRTAPATRRSEALAFLQQSRSFFDAAADRTVAAAPLILYYAFMNLAKALILAASDDIESLDRAMHGLKDDPGTAGQEITGASVAVKTGGDKPNIFPLYARALGFPVPAADSTYAVTELMGQVVVGHRLWREAGGRERFVPIDPIRFVHHPPTGSGEVWLRLYVKPDDLSRFGIAQRSLRDEGDLTSSFDYVKSDDSERLCLEQRTAMSYGHRAADVVKDVVGTMRPLLWRSATSMPPYRHYYAHLSPSARRGERLPQLLSLYLLFFYFGSVTRYRPHVFDEILESNYGPFVREFVASQPDQFLNLLASEICEREVAKPALI
jgi:hypothetical protein